MAKNIIKEIIIILLLILAIILILGVLLYEYVPVNKVIPEKISYTTPEKIQDELNTDSNVDDTQIIITYQIDSTDLSNYKTTQDYVPGKKNPFSSLVTQETNNDAEEENNTQGTSNNQSTNSNTNTQKEPEQTGYLPDKGTK
ncbi:MAG: hypothetical protein HFJ59_05155 [Clostridia bacterium]|nr:hypothetical protein [Clostridia bacterium]